MGSFAIARVVSIVEKGVSKEHRYNGVGKGRGAWGVICKSKSVSVRVGWWRGATKRVRVRAKLGTARVGRGTRDNVSCMMGGGKLCLQVRPLSCLLSFEPQGEANTIEVSAECRHVEGLSFSRSGLRGCN